MSLNSDKTFRDLRRAPRRDPGDDRAEWRGRRPRNLWWLRDFRDRLGPGMVIAFLVVVVLTAALVSVRVFYFKPDRPVVPEDSPSIFAGEISPRYGEPLSPATRLRLARFGIPLYVGPNGIPLVRDPVTGESREVSEFEMSLPEDRTVVRAGHSPDVLTQPGPSGRPVMWWQPRHLQGLPEPQLVDRIRWYQLQERQLNAFVRDLMLGLDYVGATSPSRWDDRWGRGLVAIAEALVDKYAFGDPGHWLFASSFIVCDIGIERAMTAGIGSSCPSAAFVALLDRVYASGGEIVARLDRMGRAAQLRHDYVSGALYNEYDVYVYHERSLDEIGELMDVIRVSFDEIRLQGEAHGHYLDVHLP